VINSRTHVPSGSTVASGVLISLISFFFDLELLANVISCGTLQVFTFVNAGVLVLRLQNTHLGLRPSTWILIFVLSTFGLALMIKLEFHRILTSIALLCFITSFGCILKMRVTRYVLNEFPAF
jgi:hypothetical protein